MCRQYVLLSAIESGTAFAALDGPQWVAGVIRTIRGRGHSQFQVIGQFLEVATVWQLLSPFH